MNPLLFFVWTDSNAWPKTAIQRRQWDSPVPKEGNGFTISATRSHSTMFERLSGDALRGPIQQLMEYVSLTWIINTILPPPSSWSVFMLSVRTNKDLEGWHHGLQRRASGRANLPFYMLVGLLFQAYCTPNTTCLRKETASDSEGQVPTPSREDL